MPTQVGQNSAISNKVFNAALFLESVRRRSFTNMLTGAAPSLGKEAKKAKAQTEAGAPVVRITDLEKTAGDEVNVDIFHQLRQKPVMGDKKLAGKGASLKYASFAMTIDQGRTMVDSGGRMSQQRTSHDLKKVAKALLGPYYNRLDDQICLVHLAGTRGDHDDADWILPLESDPEFAEIVVNPITPPTFDRHFYGGDATAIDNIDSADKFSIGVIDNMRLQIDEMPFPLQPIKMESDQYSEDNPFYCIFVTPRQWYDLQTETGEQSWRTMLANAHQRLGMFNHPLFRGEAIMWNNILVRKQLRPIRFNSGTNVTVCTDTVDAQTTTKTAGVAMERAILLGAQAIANAYGMTGDKARGGFHFSMHDEKTDHENVIETSIAWMNGKAKIRFKGTDGRVNDHGVMVIDTAVNSL